MLPVASFKTALRSASQSISSSCSWLIGTNPWSRAGGPFSPSIADSGATTTTADLRRPAWPLSSVPPFAARDGTHGRRLHAQLSGRDQVLSRAELVEASREGDPVLGRFRRKPGGLAHPRHQVCRTAGPVSAVALHLGQAAGRDKLRAVDP